MLLLSQEYSTIVVGRVIWLSPTIVAMEPHTEKLMRETFSKTLRESRKQAKFSQEEFADRTGLAVQYISMLERNLRRPTLTTLFSISMALKIPLSEFVAQIEKDTPGL